MEVCRNDAMVAARRSWQAMGETQDKRTRLSLARCALRYVAKAMEEDEARQTEMVAAPPARRAGGGIVQARDL